MAANGDALIQGARKRSVSAALFSLATGISRVLGLVREVISAQLLLRLSPIRVTAQVGSALRDMVEGMRYTIEDRVVRRLLLLAIAGSVLLLLLMLTMLRRMIAEQVLTPLARLLGMKVIFTHHGADYERAKWGSFAKNVLRLGEYLGVRFADTVICVSPSLQKGLQRRYPEWAARFVYLPNGATDLPRARS